MIISNDHTTNECTNTKQLPIGVFDSGMGGLTVLKELMSVLPHESFIYLGDTARLPYGTKSPETVINYALQMAHTLVARGIKLMVVACNTATTTALPHLQRTFSKLPIIGVVEPGAETAVSVTQNNTIAVLATETTIHSEVYQMTIQRMNPNITVLTQSCGLFVALTEEGWVDDEIAQAVVNKYLQPILQAQSSPDTVLLGCTHFPVLRKPLRAILGHKIQLVDSATATALSVKAALDRANLLNTNNSPQVHFLVTDLPQRFTRIGELFLGIPILSQYVSLVDNQ